MSQDQSGTGVSRRGLLGALPVAAIAGVGVAVVGDLLDSPAASAHAGDPLVLGAPNDADAAPTTLTSTTSEAVFAVLSPSGQQQTGISGGVIALTDVMNGGGGLWFKTTGGGGATVASLTVNDGLGLLTVNGKTHTVAGGHSGEPAIVADAVGTAVVLVRGKSGLKAKTELPSIGVEAVVEGHGVGVRAVSVAGSAVVGQAGPAGRGAQFSGGAAAVRMLPAAASVHPPTGLLGDFFVDATGRLWFCKGGSAWHQLA